MTINTDQYPSHYYDDGEGNVTYLNPQGADPDLIHPLPAGFWVPTARDRLWSLVKVQRETLLAGGCDVPGLGRVDTGEKSLAAIDRKLAAAQLNPDTWSDVFTMEDNEEEPVGLAEIVAIKTAVEAHEQAVRNAARAVRDDLFDEEITTLAALGAVGTDLTERMA